MQTTTAQPLKLYVERWSGLFLALTILCLWVISLIALLSVSPSTLSLGEIILVLLGRTWLQTGLFVIAHDAMHGSLVPYDKRLNLLIGTIAVNLYAGLSYQRCCLNHRNHHQHPAQIGDPDFHDGVHTDPVRWYLTFLRSYLSIRSISVLVLGSGLLFWGFNGLRSIPDVMVIWGLPLLLSSLQLFFFGTYLPHRQQPVLDRKADPGKRPWLVLWSLLSCYHFGVYHQDHHQHPQTPWYRLPNLSAARQS